MSASSQTSNYKLPIFEDRDKPSWIEDWNGAMRKIDEIKGGGGGVEFKKVPENWNGEIARLEDGYYLFGIPYWEESGTQFIDNENLNLLSSYLIRSGWLISGSLSTPLLKTCFFPETYWSGTTFLIRITRVKFERKDEFIPENPAETRFKVIVEVITCSKPELLFFKTITVNTDEYGMTAYTEGYTLANNPKPITLNFSFIGYGNFDNTTDFVFKEEFDTISKRKIDIFNKEGAGYWGEPEVNQLYLKWQNCKLFSNLDSTDFLNYLDLVMLYSSAHSIQTMYIQSVLLMDAYSFIQFLNRLALNNLLILEILYNYGGKAETVWVDITQSINLNPGSNSNIMLIQELYSTRNAAISISYSSSESGLRDINSRMPIGVELSSKLENNYNQLYLNCFYQFAPNPLSDKYIRDN